MAIFDNCNPFASGKKREDKLACFWYNQLYNKVISLYEWKGKEFEGPNATLNKDYLEWCLLTQGQAGFLKDKAGDLRGLNITRVGIDPYGYPTSLRTSNPVLGTIEGVIGVNAVWIKNNKFAVPATQVIRYYAGELAKIQLSLDISLNNNRQVKVFMAENAEQANQIRKMQDDVSEGKDAVIVKPNILTQVLSTSNGNSIPVFSTASEYLADKYLQDMRAVLDDFYTTFGINTSGANMIKHERNLVDEVNANNQSILINRAYWLEPRKEACEMCNKLFGTNISVDLRVESKEVVEDGSISESESGNEQTGDISKSEV